ncbi:hypothetical protein AMTRI_Chr06g169540 [Amborella trichopoda]
MAFLKRFAVISVAVAAFVVYKTINKEYGFDKDSILHSFRGLSEKLGLWAMPFYVLLHTVTLALCLPYAVFFEAGAALLFGFVPAVLCVFAAKVLGASLSFWIGRTVFRSSTSAMDWARSSKYFHLLTNGVAQDGWRFVLLARFSPIPSYVISYALAATNVRFFIDFLLPTIMGCLPMILQNTSIGSLANVAIGTTITSQKSRVLSYMLPLLGIGSSILISLKVKKYASEISLVDEHPASKGARTIDSNSCDLSKNSVKSGEIP